MPNYQVSLDFRRAPSDQMIAYAADEDVSKRMRHAFREAGYAAEMDVYAGAYLLDLDAEFNAGHQAVIEAIVGYPLVIQPAGPARFPSSRQVP